jgi:putative acetyltransferase
VSAVLRGYRPQESAALAALYRDSARELGPAAYTPAQVAAWVAAAEDEHAFARMLAGGFTLVIELDGALAAFGQLHPADHLALLYTAPAHARRGLGQRLAAALEDQARQAGVALIHTTASRLSRPLFAGRGWSLDEVEQSLHRGVVFERYKMSKRLAAELPPQHG